MVCAEQFLPNDQGFAYGDCLYGLACQGWNFIGLPKLTPLA